MEYCIRVVLVERMAYDLLSLNSKENIFSDQHLPTTLAVLPAGLPVPSRSTWRIVGLDGDFMILTCCEGTHG
jgi:hypothetical protein